MENILQAVNLYKTFDTVKAVDDVSFSIPQGSIFGLIGRNGAGKTTTIRMIMNIYLPDSGEVFYRGSKAGQEFKSKVGYLPEERGLYKKMKVWDTLLYFAELKGQTGREVHKKVNEYLERFNLINRKNSKVEELSKGNQQKVQFIATVLHQPDLLILDEPFAGLDPINIDILKQIILEMQEKGSTVILSTHLLDFAEKLCSSLAMIDKGKIILEGRLSDIKSKYAKKNVSLSYTGDISFLSRIPFVEKVENFGNSVGVKVKDESDIQELLILLIQNNITVSRFIKDEISLHEIFVELAGKEESSFASKEINHV